MALSPGKKYSSHARNFEDFDHVNDRFGQLEKTLQITVQVVVQAVGDYAAIKDHIALVVNDIVLLESVRPQNSEMFISDFTSAAAAMSTSKEPMQQSFGQPANGIERLTDSSSILTVQLT